MRLQVDGQIWLPMHVDKPETIDPKTLGAADVYFAALLGQFTLGGLVRCIDVHGMDGEQLSATPGYISMGGQGGDKLYRVATLMIPLLVNQVTTLTP